MINPHPQANLKSISPTALYNMTQDGLHLVILDFRRSQNYISSFIRRSYHLGPKDDSLKVMHELFNYIEKAAANIEASAKKYNTPKTKRLVAVVETSDCSLVEAETFLTSANLFEHFDRKYVLLDSFEKFQLKYRFLTLTLPEAALAFDGDQRHQYLVDNHQQELIYANSQFPLEIIEDKVFLGSNFNKNSSKQRSDLGIGYSVEVKKSSEAHNVVTLDIDKRDIVVSFDLEKMIDFDTMISEVTTSAKDERILICGSDLDITAGFLIAMIMKSFKLEINAASLRVFSKMGNTTVDRTLYNHLIHYTPGKIQFKKI
jgi:hypothetical protein